MQRLLPVVATCAAILWSSVPVVSTSAEKPQPELLPGLIATHRDTAAAPHEYTTIESTVGLFLKANETQHPSLRSGALTARWEGRLRILRRDTYRFSAVVAGHVRVLVDQKEVLNADAKGPPAERREGPEVILEPGLHEFVAEFSAQGRPARLQLRWHAGHFHEEPVPFQVFGHFPAQVPPKLLEEALRERGRVLVQERQCSACHLPEDGDALAKSLSPHKAPDLSKAGERLDARWMLAWLENPQRLRPDAAMPQVFADSHVGRQEAYAVARYLASLGGPLKHKAEPLNANDLRTSSGRGERLFHSVGCAVCHTLEPARADVHHVLLVRLAEKTTTPELARFLQDPHATRPDGRMPNMLLNSQEASDLARFLRREAAAFPAAPAPAQAVAQTLFDQVESRPAERQAFTKLVPEKQWLELGQRLVMEKRCNTCHTIAPAGKPFAQFAAEAEFTAVRRAAQTEKGCLGSPFADTPAPRFSWTQGDRAAVRAFLALPMAFAGTAAPAHASRQSLARFNCLSCHERAGQGGLTTELIDTLRKFETVESAEALTPPPLTSAGAKLQTGWMHQVLLERGRARPWMSLRMPQFGTASVGHLPAALAACDGVDPDEKPDQPPFDTKQVEAGKLLVGKKAFGCIGCHDIAGVAASGTRGPDLALMQNRVRYDWYRQWLEQPQRMQPGTRMPTIFTDGRSLMDEVLGGRADAQSAAMWNYLALGMNLPLPEGLEPPRGLVLVPKERPIVIRTFLPDIGSKGIAVGYPGGVSVAFDAATCRLAYAWTGNFLDAGPAWNDRGGNPAKLLGPRFWESPASFPWAMTAAGAIPNFTAQARDPAFGAAPSEGTLYTGPRRAQFVGHETDSLGQPAFRYELDAAGINLQVRERLTPQHHAAAVGLLRHFDIQQPPSVDVWLRVALSSGEPEWIGAHRKPTTELRTAQARGVSLLVPLATGRTLVVKAAEAPDEADWHVRKVQDGWELLLHLPPIAKATSRRVGVLLWQPHRPERALLQELATVTAKP